MTRTKTKTAGTDATKWNWIAFGAALVAIVAAWHFLPVKDWLKALDGWVAGRGILGPVLYALVYLVAELLMVPGAILTIGAGFLFGLAGGTAVVWAAATAAAALAFLVARHFARERVERYARRHRKFAALDAAIEEGNWKVVALLRFSPIVPFALSNYMYGLTRIGFGPYIAATAFGMLPGAFLYVCLGAAGKTLGEDGGYSPWHWAMLGAGLLATIAATVYLTRVAKKRLKRKRAA